jgi:hypothetical protein
VTREEILKIWPNASESLVRRNLTYDNASNTQGNPSPKHEEQPKHNPTANQREQALRTVRIKENVAANVDNQFRLQSLDARLPKKFRLTITSRFSDRRAHDINGAASTLLDVIRDAARQLAAESPEMADWISRNVPLDDSWIIVPELIVKAEACAKGDDGASVTIETL